jgi:hypothetical protein
MEHRLSPLFPAKPMSSDIKTITHRLVTTKEALRIPDKKDPLIGKSNLERPKIITI